LFLELVLRFLAVALLGGKKREKKKGFVHTTDQPGFAAVKNAWEEIKIKRKNRALTYPVYSLLGHGVRRPGRGLPL
jgi:hypothetical protein